MDTHDDASLVSQTSTGLHVPASSLCSCIRAYVTRSTLDAPHMTASQRRNHFSAAPFCVMSWVLQGESVLIRQGDTETDIALPRPVSFGGVRTEPVVTANPGGVDLFMVILLPEALHALTGIDMAAHTNRASPFEEVFNTEWQAMAREVFTAPDHATRIKLVEAFFEPRWEAARLRHGLQTGWVQDHLQGAALRLYTSQWARGLRQLERRIKSWCGVPLQRLSGMRRNEQRFLATTAVLKQDGPISWAGIAADTGYADQAHFCRETRKVTGLSPKELLRRAREEESYWMYRVWS